MDSDLFNAPCNFLDEVVNRKTILNKDLYSTANESCAESSGGYICMACQPFFLSTLKAQRDFQNMKVVEECLPTKTSTSNSCTEQRSNISKSYDEIPMDISSQSVRETSADCTSNLLDDPDQT